MADHAQQQNAHFSYRQLQAYFLNQMSKLITFEVHVPCGSSGLDNWYSSSERFRFFRNLNSEKNSQQTKWPILYHYSIARYQQFEIFISDFTTNNLMNKNFLSERSF